MIEKRMHMHITILRLSKCYNLNPKINWTPQLNTISARFASMKLEIKLSTDVLLSIYL